MTTDRRFIERTPFARLLMTHAASACGDACVAASLAGSLFFQNPSDSARGDILLYLLLTMAPFAIVAPIIGPALDRLRGGRRLLVVFSCVGRALLCLAMAQFITEPSPEGLLIYPLAFGVLVLAKGYTVARSALVPALVDDESQLVKANSRLALISAIAGAAGGVPAFGVQQLFGADWSLVLAMFVFATAAVLGTRIPRTQIVLNRDEQQLEKEEIHQPSILLAGSAMAVLRGGVGFMQFFTAFTFKEDLFKLGVVAAMAIAGNLAGNLVAPVLRQHVREEIMLVSSLLVAAGLGLLGVLMGGTIGFGLAALVIAVSAAAGRVAFDSLLQRDGPDAARGRAFAYFEMRFQLAQVVGGLIGLIPLGASLGLGTLDIVLVVTGLSYLAALRTARTRPQRSKLRPESVERAMDRAVGRAREGLRERYGRTRAGRRRAAAAERKRRRRPTRTPGDPPDAFPDGG